MTHDAHLTLTGHAPTDLRILISHMHTTGHLTTRQHDAIILRINGLPWHTIALTLGTTIRSARTHHDRALQRVLDHMTA